MGLPHPGPHTCCTEAPGGVGGEEGGRVGEGGRKVEKARRTFVLDFKH